MAMTSDAWQTVLLALIAAAVTLGAPIIAFLLAKVSSGQSKALTQGDLIHKTVNSGQTALLEEQKRLQEKILELSEINATLLEIARPASQRKRP